MDTLADELSEHTKLMWSASMKPEVTGQYMAVPIELLARAIKVLRGFEWVAGVYDGEELTAEKVGAELADYHMILGEVPKVYMHVTGGLLSKPNYHANGVISAADDHMTRLCAEEIADATEPLVEALKALVEDSYPIGNGEDDSVREMALAAIAKAERA